MKPSRLMRHLETKHSSVKEKVSFHNDSMDLKVVLAAGAFAGFSVDVLLFPIDTIKTRLQSAAGFTKAGGFRNIYSGLGSVLIGSSPGAATFFFTYEMIKLLISPIVDAQYYPLVHMGSASVSEMVSCIIRVPTEVIKQRTQANSNISSWVVLKKTIHSEGVRGIYRGYTSTVLREIPFSLIQFPIWEYLKITISQKQGYYVQPWQAALCGGVSGGIAAALTTPIDVAKTRIMLADKKSITAKGYIISVMGEIWKTEGLKGIFSGIVPRILWISLGGVIFFGAYETAKGVL